MRRIGKRSANTSTIAALLATVATINPCNSSWLAIVNLLQQFAQLIHIFFAQFSMRGKVRYQRRNPAIE
jgi:hypothetical protein